MNEGVRELGVREAADPEAWVAGESILPVLPPGFAVCALSDTPPPTHMLLERTLLQQGPGLLVIH